MVSTLIFDCFVMATVFLYLQSSKKTKIISKIMELALAVTGVVLSGFMRAEYDSGLYDLRDTGVKTGTMDELYNLIVCLAPIFVYLMIVIVKKNIGKITITAYICAILSFSVFVIFGEMNGEMFINNQKIQGFLEVLETLGIFLAPMLLYCVVVFAVKLVKRENLTKPD